MNKFKLFIVLLVFGYGPYKSNVNAKRISELKCEEIATLVTNPQSTHPYLMGIYFKVPSTPLFVGTLISENFVLSTAHHIKSYKERISDLIIRKYLLPDERYINRVTFSIKRIFLHALHADDLSWMQHDIGLIQLNEPVNLETSSIFRPACLKSDIPDSFNAYQLFVYNDNEEPKTLLAKSFPSAGKDKCVGTGENVNSTEYIMCFNTAGFYAAYDSPVSLKIDNQNYIIGIISWSYSTADPLFTVALKFNHAIDWIETIVWPIDLTVKPSLKCGERKMKHRPHMSYSQPSYHGEFPWHVALFNQQLYICGGSILSSRFILTAAHCVQDDRGVLPHNRIIVLVGSHTLNNSPSDAHYYFTTKVIVHENYNRHYLENDIALLKMLFPITFSNYVQPICLSNPTEYSNITMGTVTGWGQTEHGLPSNLLLQAVLPIVDEFSCRETNRGFFANYLNSRNYCAGYDNGTNVCSGDSGGAMIFEHNSQYYIRGIVSLGVALQNSARCDITELVLFTNVNMFYGWIQQHLENEQ